MKKALIIITVLIFSIANLTLVANAQSSSDVQSGHQPPQITVTFPLNDLPVSGAFSIKGTATNKDTSIQNITVTLTSLYDRKQTPVTSIPAKYNENTHTWSAKIQKDSLEEGMYMVQVEARDSNNKPSYTFSSITVSSNDNLIRLI